MTLLLTIVAFIVIFSVLVIVHECGHFFTAKKAGIKVEEFGFGLPPRIWGYKPKNSETMYSLNAIPFGGFVRLYGEDSHDKKMATDKRSFAAQKPRVQMAVIVAGVVMNLALAVLLLMIGFLFGMQPLFLSPEDVYQSINTGGVDIANGLRIKSIPLNSAFHPGDQLVKINQQSATDVNLDDLKDGDTVSMTALRGNQTIDATFNWSKDHPPVTLYDVAFIPRVVLHDVSHAQIFLAAGLKNGDTVLKIDGQQIFSQTDFEQDLQNNKDHTLEVLRDQDIQDITVKYAQTASLVISEILPKSPAEQFGLQPGDEILKLNDQPITSSEDLLQAMKKKQGDVQKYSIRRQGSLIDFSIKPGADGLVGIALAPLYTNRIDDMSYYVTPVATSILSIHDVRYCIWEAPVKAVEETGRLGVLTAKMFGTVISSIVTKFTIPEGVSGPVGIAQMTYTFVQQGLLSLIRFTALLSLSLAVINILPFPGLDGGRFFLILISVILGKKINPKIESYIHVIGFLILMGLIGLITYNDIVHLFTK